MLCAAPLSAGYAQEQVDELVQEIVVRDTRVSMAGEGWGVEGLRIRVSTAGWGGLGLVL